MEAQYQSYLPAYANLLQRVFNQMQPKQGSRAFRILLGKKTVAELDSLPTNGTAPIDQVNRFYFHGEGLAAFLQELLPDHEFQFKDTKFEGTKKDAPPYYIACNIAPGHDAVTMVEEAKKALTAYCAFPRALRALDRSFGIGFITPSNVKPTMENVSDFEVRINIQGTGLSAADKDKFCSFLSANLGAVFSDFQKTHHTDDPIIAARFSAADDGARKALACLLTLQHELHYPVDTLALSRITAQAEHRRARARG